MDESAHLVSHDEFEALVKEAIDNIPEEYADVHENVVFKIEDMPTPQQRYMLNLHPRSALYGLFEGITRPQRSSQMSGLLPATITIFRFPMTHMFSEKDSLKKQIYETVWHEVAHYFGLNHEAMHRVKSSGEHS